MGIPCFAGISDIFAGASFGLGAACVGGMAEMCGLVVLFSGTAALVTLIASGILFSGVIGYVAYRTCVKTTTV